jgi:hypothetical protein
MAKISKAAGAPSGAINVSIGSVSFTVDASPYVTDDREVVEAIKNSYSDLFTVVEDDAPVAPPAPTSDPVDDPKTPAADWKE